jgi:hypothetical protein
MMLSRWLTQFLPDTIEQRPRSSAFLKICVTPGAAIARWWYRRLRLFKPALVERGVLFARG